MHPEIIRDKPGPCPVCSMPLVKAESLGFTGKQASSATPPLVIPASAPLLTGKRAVVYVELADRETPTYQGRDVSLGSRAGDWYLVREGLEEGERVVVHGNFKLDSDLQISGRPSMMLPLLGEEATSQPSSQPATGGSGHSGHNHGAAEAPMSMDVPDAFRSQLGALFTTYLALQSALAGDDDATATTAGTEAELALKAIQESLLEGKARKHWENSQIELAASLEEIQDAKGIEERRQGFALFSEALASALRAFGYQGTEEARIMSCPMAFNNRGARWLQADDQLLNPYFGAAMLRCGSKEGVISRP